MTSIFGLKTLSNILLALSNSLHYSCRPSPDSPHVSIWIFENQWKMMIFNFFQNLLKINRKHFQVRFLVSERLYQTLEAFVLRYIAIIIILEDSSKVWIFGRNCKKLWISSALEKKESGQYLGRKWPEEHSIAENVFFEVFWSRFIPLSFIDHPCIRSHTPLKIIFEMTFLVYF